ncbi:hypothetical protein Vafri_20970 [Volvox africanus]|uniref:Uncharacterized protein n=1 Tax=Volvox africanus TaxID=51714 RepID=A0A8J4BSL7_9CHLO|nr:hypothetical protein Vafri_20970 [Volvox africanus]
MLAAACSSPPPRRTHHPQPTGLAYYQRRHRCYGEHRRRRQGQLRPMLQLLQQEQLRGSLEVLDLPFDHQPPPARSASAPPAPPIRRLLSPLSKWPGRHLRAPLQPEPHASSVAWQSRATATAARMPYLDPPRPPPGPPRLPGSGWRWQLALGPAAVPFPPLPPPGAAAADDPVSPSPRPLGSAGWPAWAIRLDPPQRQPLGTPACLHFLLPPRHPPKRQSLTRQVLKRHRVLLLAPLQPVVRDEWVPDRANRTDDEPGSDEAGAVALTPLQPPCQPPPSS